MSEALNDGESRNLHLIAERIRSRRTTKLFLREEVSWELIRDAIEVARWAPNHHVTEPWHFYLLGARKIADAARLIGDLIRETLGDKGCEIEIEPEPATKREPVGDGSVGRMACGRELREHGQV